MKTWNSGIVCLLAIAQVNAQNLNPIGELDHLTYPAPSDYLAGERGADHQEVLKVVSLTNEIGRVTLQTNLAYVTLATGMHFRNGNGQWLPSREQIDVLRDGTAAATNGSHRVYFPSDIYDGVIRIVTPTGELLQNRPMGISYRDGSNSVLIAELTNSVGRILPSGNEVIYTNCFTDVKADLRCIYRKSGFEADVVFRESLPSPVEFGLDSANTRLQVLTEFFETPEPTKVSGAIDSEMGLRDTTLKFGEQMKMAAGKAFSTARGDSSLSNPLRVFKSWERLTDTANPTVERTFLIEELPYDRIKPELDALSSDSERRQASIDSRQKASSKQRLPPMRTAQNEKPSQGGIELVSVDLNQRPGVVFDYILKAGSTNSFVFEGDKTYLIGSNNFNIYGPAVLEGGAVIKFATNAPYWALYFDGTIDCQTGPYRPVIFTAVGDDTVGENIDNTTVPKTYQSALGIDFDTPSGTTLQYVRVSYAATAVDAWAALNLRHCQFVNVGKAVVNWGGTFNLENLLINGASDDVFSGVGGSYYQFRASHLTVHEAHRLIPSGTVLSVTNSILASITNLGPAFTSVNNSTNDSGAGLFQSVGAGNHYLVSESSNRNAGATSINPLLLADLKQKTTFPPILLANETNSVDTVLDRQAQRDTDTPDLGYHYDPLDYITHLYTYINADLVLTNGTAVASYNDSGFILGDNSSITSIGTPLAPNWFTRYYSVQEQPVSLGGSGPSSGGNVRPDHYGGGPSGTFQFSKFSCPAGGGYGFYHYAERWSFSNLLVRDCEVWGGINQIPGVTNSTARFSNTLFYRATINDLNYANSTNVTLSFSNNLIFNNSSVIIRPGTANSSSSLFFDNSFDNCTFGAIQQACSNGYNAYINCNKQLNPTNVNNVVLTSFTYAHGSLGDFYQTSTNLQNLGSIDADRAGLYHYTAQANQTKEAKSRLDIGFHYVAVDSTEAPIDTNGDGIADYLQDANGNGFLDLGETPFGISIENPINGAVLSK